MQVAIVIGIVAIAGAAFGAGYTLHDMRNTVRGAPAVHEALWQAVNANTRNINSITDKMDEVIDAVNDTRCYARARTEDELDACEEQGDRPLQPINTGRN